MGGREQTMTRASHGERCSAQGRTSFAHGDAPQRLPRLDGFAYAFSLNWNEGCITSGMLLPYEGGRRIVAHQNRGKVSS